MGSERGEKHGRAVLTEKKVRQIRASAGTIRELADQYGVSETALRYAKNGLTWKHIPLSGKGILMDNDTILELNAHSIHVTSVINPDRVVLAEGTVVTVVLPRRRYVITDVVSGDSPEYILRPEGN